MPEETFKPVTEADLELTPKELAYLVAGAQRYLPPEDENGEPIPTDYANRP